jgi:transcriptional regulator with XRE-family HTH domain
VPTTLRFAGKRVARARKLHRPPLSQAALARRRGVSQAFIALLETGYRDPTLEMLAGIADDLGVPVDYFFTSDDDEVDE